MVNKLPNVTAVSIKWRKDSSEVSVSPTCSLILTCAMDHKFSPF